MSSQHAGQKRRRLSTNSDLQDDSTARIKAACESSGAAVQHNNSGTGNQNNNSGFGSQYNATNINFVNKEKDNFLTDLRVTDPRDDKKRIERTKGNLLRDSYRWILDHDDFGQWRADKRLLWIKGGPGKGKTMLLCGIIDELLAMGYTSTFFFFCQAADARLNTATSVLRGLLYVLLRENPILHDLLREQYDQARGGRQLFEDINGWEVLCEMFSFAVGHESMHNTILVIDALDECVSGLDQLISFIIDLTAHTKVIASSRPDLRINRGLAAALENTKVYLSLELNEVVVSAAVDNYINHKTQQLANLKGYNDDTKINVKKYLAANASHTFLWVALVYEQLADNRVAARHTQQMLQRFPPGLDSLYQRILDQILGSLDAENCREILAVMSIVSRPLDLAELVSILDHIQFVMEIVDECGSLLVVREGVIYFVHQSAKDFLLRQTHRIMPLGLAHNHNIVLSKLLLSMSDTLRRNIYDVDKHGVPVEEIRVPCPDPLVYVRQQKDHHWGSH
ncbi:nacht and wd domain protein [Colletotrichum asianum]|uniref:Nacht and wd domain protein n=1 Tax=Colletotrichum asianum TaxID=702518 RepID=A0A8H3WDG7_9PEZI|nr:nacht and wd domain protein [Colletotrichum asianum]